MLIAALTVLLLGAAGAWVAQHQVTRNEAQKVLDLRETRDDLQDKLDIAQDRLEEVSAENEDRKSREADLAAAEAAVAQRENEIGTREAAVTATEQQIAANTIQPGRWTVGTDVEPGAYRVAEPVVGTRCYWKISVTGSNGDDIVANDFGTQGNLSVTLSDGQDFESSNCGSWVKQ
jgi:cytoskeletal protein RodZ